MSQNKIEKNYTEQDFKSLLVSRVEIEEVLGLTINQKKNNYNQYLDDYSLFPELHLHDVVCIFLGFHPKDCNAECHPRYEIIYEAIKQLAETGKIKATVEGERHFKSVFLPHATARAIAQSQGFDWNVPPYKDIVNTNTTLNVITQSDNSEQINILQRQINVKNEEITQLQARIAELEKELADKTITPQEETGDKYTSTERQTHLQAIATLSFRLAESNKSSLMTTTGKTNNSKIAEILEKEAKELFTDPKTKETFRKRISEAINTFQPQAE